MCIDFHHRDPKTKSFTIGGGSVNYSFKSIMKEIDKCVSVCKNCHALYHAGLLPKPTRIHRLPQKLNLVPVVVQRPRSRQPRSMVD